MNMATNEKNLSINPNIKKLREKFVWGERLIKGLRVGSNAYYGLCINDNYLNIREAVRFYRAAEVRDYSVHLISRECKSLVTDGFLRLGNIGEMDGGSCMINKLEAIMRLNINESGKISGRTGAINKSFAWEVIRAILKPYIVNIIKEYLESERIYLYSPCVLFTKAYDWDKMGEKERSDKAFVMHRDIDAARWLKLFISLNDNIGGAHEYVRASHGGTQSLDDSHIMEYIEKDATRRHMFNKEADLFTILGTHLHEGRISRDSIIELFGIDSLVEFSCKLGEAWLEDTYGLHRGSPVKKGYRGLISVLIADTPINYG